MKLSDLKTQLRDGPYAWPGGYPKFALMSDGETMHIECIKANWREIVGAHLVHNLRGNGWFCEAVDINYEDSSLYCAHCNERIESAYAEDEAIN